LRAACAAVRRGAFGAAAFTVFAGALRATCPELRRGAVFFAGALRAAVFLVTAFRATALRLGAFLAALRAVTFRAAAFRALAAFLLGLRRFRLIGNGSGRRFLRFAIAVLSRTLSCCYLDSYR